MVVGILVGIWPSVPLALGIIAITLVRLPINIYNTFKIAFNTVLLKRDLRILILILLPVVHLLFIVIAPIAAIFVSCGFCVFATSVAAFGIGFNHGDSNIFSGIFEVWIRTPEIIKIYWKRHDEFVADVSQQYDHESGIPQGWDGTRYGIPIGPFQIVIGLIIAIYSLTVGLLGMTIHNCIKIVPCTFYSGCKMIKWLSECRDFSCLCGCSPCILLLLIVGVCCIPVGFVLSILGLALASLHSVKTFIQYDSVKLALKEPINLLIWVDNSSSELTFTGFKIFFLIKHWLPTDFLTPQGLHLLPRNLPAEKSTTKQPTNEKFWYAFTNESISTVQELSDKGWIDVDEVACASPGVVVSIPAVTVLRILVRSSEKSGEDIIIFKNGAVCSKENRVNDGITDLLLPKLLGIKQILVKNPQLCSKDYVDFLTADILDGSDEPTEVLKMFLKNRDLAKDKNHTLIKSKLVELVLAGSRLKSYADSMPVVFGHDYEVGQKQIE